MARMVTVAQAAYLVRLNERAVRYHIGKGHLTPTVGEDGHARLDVEQIARIPGWKIDPARLAELDAQEERTAMALADRLRLLERRIAALERLWLQASGADSMEPLYRVSEARDAHGSVPTPVGAASGADDLLAASESVSRSTATPRRSPPTMRLASGLPDGLVSWRSFASLHGVPETTVQKAIDGGRLRAVEGRWKDGRAIVLRALDGDGRAAFYAAWGDRDDFIRCAQCPHA